MISERSSNSVQGLRFSGDSEHVRVRLGLAFSRFFAKFRQNPKIQKSLFGRWAVSTQLCGKNFAGIKFGPRWRHTGRGTSFVMSLAQLDAKLTFRLIAQKSAKRPKTAQNAQLQKVFDGRKPISGWRGLLMTL